MSLPAGRRCRPAFARKAGLAGGGVAAALLLAEAGLRLAGHDITEFMQRDPELGWCNRPGVRVRYTKESDGLVEINSLGLRDRERTLAKPPGTFRIVVLGDSMTMGAEVGPEETFCRVAERQLAAGAPPVVEVLNLGVVGYAPVQELLLLRRDGFRFDPDLVVVAVFLDNDIGGSSRAIGINPGGTPYPYLENGDLRVDTSPARIGFDEFQREPKRTLRAWSHLYNIAYKVASRWRGPPMASVQGGPVPVSYEVYRRSWTPVWDEAWAATQRVYGECARECREHDVPLVLLSIPAGVAVHDPSWNDMLAHYPAMRAMEWDREGPDRRLAEFATQHAIERIGAFELFRARVATEQLYFGSGGLQLGHLDARGHALLAGLLVEELARRRLLPRR